MTEIEIDTRALREAGEVFERSSRLLREAAYEIDYVRHNLRQTTSIERFRVVLKKQMDEAERLTYTVGRLGRVLNEAAMLYGETERRLEGEIMIFKNPANFKSHLYFRDENYSPKAVASARKSIPVLKYINLI